MNSKKALMELYAISNCTKCEHYSECNDGHGTICDINKNVILKDLERLERLEKWNQVLMNKALEISNKLTMYKKALHLIKCYLTDTTLYNETLIDFVKKHFTELDVKFLEEVLEDE